MYFLTAIWYHIHFKAIDAIRWIILHQNSIPHIQKEKKNSLTKLRLINSERIDKKNSMSSKVASKKINKLQRMLRFESITMSTPIISITTNHQKEEKITLFIYSIFGVQKKKFLSNSALNDSTHSLSCWNDCKIYSCRSIF